MVDTLGLREKSMMEKRKRRKFTPEFKAEAVKQDVVSDDP